MNNTRRRQLDKIAEKIDELKEEIELLIEEEDTARENMAENSEKYEISEEASDNMQSAIYSLDEAFEYLTSAAQ